MPTTLETLARQVVGAVDGDTGYLLAAQWIVRRYQELATRFRFRHLRQLGQLYVPAPITTGSATFTRDSQIVTGDAAATAAWSPDVVGRHIRAHNAWYEIIGYQVVSTVGQLTLKNKYTEDDGSLTYFLVQRWVTLPADVLYIGKSLLNERRRLPIEKTSLEELDAEAPSRQMVGQAAYIACEISDSLDGRKRMEFYPYSNLSESYWFAYWTDVPTFAITDPIPTRMPGYILVEGALIDLYRYKMSQAAAKGQVDIAGFWRNEMNTQRTLWNRDCGQAAAADRGDDDATFILKHAGLKLRDFDITNAHDYVYNNWPR